MHAPLTSRRVTDRQNTPWFNDELRVAKVKRRKLERKWNQSRLEIDHQILRDHCKFYMKVISDAKKTFHRTRIAQCDNKKLFQVVNTLIKGPQNATLPAHVDETVMAQSFSDYFHTKIKTIRDELDETVNAIQLSDCHPRCDSSLATFDVVTEDEMDKFITESPSKSCSMDPIPTTLLKSVTPAILPILTEIINTSMTSGIVPETFKRALITPLIKKATLDSECLKNYRPISNLSFLSKLLERVVAKQLHSYLHRHTLYDKMQSAYRQGHSTETALLRVKNDLLLALDERKDVALIMLDLSAAFDTIDHTILLDRLQYSFGIKDTVLSWFASYITSRSQSVAINSHSSRPRLLEYGVPQGSVLGPVLFSLYMSPLSQIMIDHGVRYMLYADDSQLYMSLDKDSSSTTITRLENCVSDIRQWMQLNKLKLNDAKTEVIHFASKYRLPQPFHGVTVGNNSIAPSRTVKNLGVFLDSTLTMSRQVSGIVSSASMAIRNIGKVRRYLDITTTERLVHAFVSSRLDYCNSLMYGIQDYELSRLQRVQNSAARVVTLAKKKQHITPMLYKLHWLPVKQRIEFKIALITFKALNDLGPLYLKELVSLYTPGRPLRSADKQLLVTPTVNTLTYGARSYASAAPRVWNTLPFDLRNSCNLNTFKTKLKTHLFKLNFG